MPIRFPDDDEDFNKPKKPFWEDDNGEGSQQVKPSLGKVEDDSQSSSLTGNDTVAPSQEEKKPDLSFTQQAFDLLDAGGNLVRKKISESYVKPGEKPVTEDGRFSAKAMFANMAGVPLQEMSISDRTRSFTDDLNDLIKAPFEMDASKVTKAGSSLATRLAETLGFVATEAATDPTTLLGGAIAKGTLKGANIASKAVPRLSGDLAKASVASGLYGGLLGAANQMSQEEGSNTPYIGPIEGAATFAAAPVVPAVFGKAADAGNKAISGWLGNKTIKYGNKELSLSEYPIAKDVSDAAHKKANKIALEIKQGYLNGLKNLDDASAIRVNEFNREAKILQNNLTLESYWAQAREIYGDAKVQKEYKKVLDEQNLGLLAEREEFLKSYGVTRPADLPEMAKREYDQISPDDVQVRTKAVDSLLESSDPSGQVKRYQWNLARDNAQKTFKEKHFDDMSKSLYNDEKAAVLSLIEANEKTKKAYNEAKSYDEFFNPNMQFRTKSKLVDDASINLPKISDYQNKPIIEESVTTTSSPNFVYVPGLLYKKTDDSIGVYQQGITVPGTTDTKSVKTYTGENSSGPVASDLRIPGQTEGWSELPGTNLMIKGGDKDSLARQPLVGFDVHQADVYEKRAFDLSKKIAQSTSGAKRGLKAGESEAVQKLIAEGVPPREAYARAYSVYADDFAKAFLSDHDKEMMAITRAAQNNFSDGGVKVYDKLTEVFKKKVLFLNTSWSMINYWDNLSKVFIERGWGDALKTARMGGVSSDLAKDIDSVMRGNPTTILGKRAEELIKYDVIGSDYYQEIASLTDAEKRLRYSPDSKVFEGYQPKDAPDKIVNTIESYNEKLFNTPGVKQFSNFTRNMGQQFEWNARAVTYDSIVKSQEAAALKAGREITPELADKIRKEAGAAVNEIFFDYGKMSAIERELAKRTLPFYSYMSKNMAYYANRVVDPTKTSRLNQLIDITGSSGRSAERDEEYGAVSKQNPHFNKGNARRMQGDQDFLTYALTPKLSMNDFFYTVANPMSAVKQGLNPFLKALGEIGSGTDWFSGQPLDPSKNPFGGKNYLGQKGYQGLIANQVLGPYWTASPQYNFDQVKAGEVPASRLAKDGINAVLGLQGVKPNEKTGSPETDSAATMYQQKMRDWVPLLPPLGGVGTAYNVMNSPMFDSIGRMVYQGMNMGDDDKNKASDLFLKLFTPVEMIKKDESQFIKKKKDLEKNEKKQQRKYQKDIRERERREQD